MPKVISWIAIAFLVTAGSVWWMGATPAPQNGVDDKAPRIVWSVGKVSETTFPGTSLTTTISFRSSQELTNVIVEPTPSLQNVLVMTPTSFATIAANHDYPLTLVFKAPSEFKKLEFEGTVHLKNGGQPPKTYPNPIEVDLKTDWNTTLSVGGDFSVAYPLNWTPHLYGNTLTISSTSTLPVLEGDAGNEIQIVALPSNNSPTLQAWLADYYKGEINWVNTPIASYTNPAGVHFLLLRGVPALSSDNMNAFAMIGGQVVQLSITPASTLQSVLTTMLISVVPR